jgi:hypothetical protein
MSLNSSGPTAVATVAEARKSDRQDSSTTSEHNACAGMSQELRIDTIKAHIAAGEKAKGKAEQHFISAGLHLKTLRVEHGGTWAAWAKLLNKVGISVDRASELMQLADGRKTVEGLRAATAARNADHRRRKKSSSSRDEDRATCPRRKVSRKKKREKFDEVDRFVSRIIGLDRDLARALYDLLSGDRYLQKVCDLQFELEKALGLYDDGDSGNDVDAEASAAARKACFAAEGAS